MLGGGELGGGDSDAEMRGGQRIENGETYRWTPLLLIEDEF